MKHATNKGRIFNTTYWKTAKRKYGAEWITTTT